MRAGALHLLLGVSEAKLIREQVASLGSNQAERWNDPDNALAAHDTMISTPSMHEN